MIEKILLFIAINLLYSIVSYFIAFFKNSKLEHGFLFEIKQEQIKRFKWLFHFRKRKDVTILKTCYYTQVFSVLRFMLSIVAAIIVGLIEPAFFQKTSLLILFIGYIIITGILESCFRLVTFIIDYFKKMKNKGEQDKGEASVNWLKALTILLVILIVSSATGLIVLANIHSKNEGGVEGTGFIRKEVFGLRGDSFDVDDHGNIYFAVNGPLTQYVSIYDNNGKYKYSLKVFTSGSIRVRIDDENNILIGFLREHEIAYYTNEGLLMNTEEDVSSFYQDGFHYSGRTRERNDAIYIFRNGRIIKQINGIQSIVFIVPTWQRWYGAIELILIFSCIGLFLRICIPIWAKEFRKMNKNIERIKKEQEENKERTGRG